MAERTTSIRQEIRIAPLQKLMLTPALLQKIELLTLSNLELKDRVQEELLQNPVLEAGRSDPELVSISNLGDGPASQPSQDGAKPDSFENVDFGPFFQDYMDPGYRTRDYEDVERPGFETFAVKAPTLEEHLTWQLNLVEEPPEVIAAAAQIIGNLDEGGYLRADIAEIAGMCGSDLATVERALLLVHQLDPAGVGARDLRECLMVQLAQAEENDTLAWDILDRHADALESGKLGEIARAEGASVEEVDDAIRRIRRLNPKPGYQLQPDSLLYIQPDVTILKVGSEYVIQLNEDGMPRLRISPRYKRMLESGGLHGEDRRYVRERFKSAIELIRNLDHRKRTVYRVCEVIVDRQREFLDNGIAFLKPMQLKDVAEDLGLATSTISRAATRKWVNCPQGVLELRQFFTLGFKTGSGEDMSIHNLKQKIKRFIDSEDKADPLPDDVLKSVLNRQGIEIKRRTVAKYREEMGIPNSRQRRTKNLPSEVT